MLKNAILLCLIMLFLKVNSQTKLQYKITSNGANIGVLYANKQEENKMVTYSVTSDSKFKLFLTVNFAYKLNCIYKNNELVFSTVTTFVNGQKHSTSTAEKMQPNSYILKNNGHEKRLYKNINYSGVLLYFKEPKNISNVFSEFYNNLNPIQKIATNTYQLTNSLNGNLSEYYYQNGILITATIHHTLMSFKLELITE